MPKVNVLASLLCGSGHQEPVSCLLDVTSLVSNVALVFLWSLVLIYTSSALRKSPGRPRKESSTRYPCHDVRWIAALTLVVVHLTDLAELLLKDGQHDWKQLSAPACSGLAVFISCVYFDRIEVSCPSLSLIKIRTAWPTWQQVPSQQSGFIAVRLDCWPK